jgi:hypothetical protein
MMIENQTVPANSPVKKGRRYDRYVLSRKNSPK